MRLVRHTPCHCFGPRAVQRSAVLRGVARCCPLPSSAVLCSTPARYCAHSPQYYPALLRGILGYACGTLSNSTDLCGTALTVLSRWFKACTLAACSSARLRSLAGNLGSLRLLTSSARHAEPSSHCGEVRTRSAKPNKRTKTKARQWLRLELILRKPTIAKLPKQGGLGGPASQQGSGRALVCACE